MATTGSSTSRRAIQKAGQAACAVSKGVYPHKVRRVRTSTSFHRPKTLQLSRSPKYPGKSINSELGLGASDVVLFPLNTERAIKAIEEHNTLVFVVNVECNKRQIKNALKSLYDLDVVKVNTLVRPNGTKKALVRLSPDTDALDVAATKLNIV